VTAKANTANGSQCHSKICHCHAHLSQVRELLHAVLLFTRHNVGGLVYPHHCAALHDTLLQCVQVRGHSSSSVQRFVDVHFKVTETCVHQMQQAALTACVRLQHPMGHWTVENEKGC